MTSFPYLSPPPPPPPPPLPFIATRDYEPVSIELATCCANITIINDIILEVKETFLISLSSDDPLVITLNSAAVHITDNDSKHFNVTSTM